VIRGKAVSDGPYAVKGEGVAGYIIVSAKNIDDAAGLAMNCPILEGDGVVEVRAMV